MHTFLARANAIFAFAFSTLAVLTFLCFCTTVFDDRQPIVSLSVNEHHVEPVRQHARSKYKVDLAVLTFKLYADVTNLFDWNTKELFLYVTAEYETDKNGVNQVVIWDRIIERGSGADIIDEPVVRAKYPMLDDGNGFRNNKNVSLSLHWNVIPNAGLLPRKSSGHTNIAFGKYS